MKNMKMVLWFTLIVTEMLLLGCNKKAEAQENSKTGSAKKVVYNSESDFQVDWDPNVKDAVIITKYIGSKREVNVPPSIQNNTVTTIMNTAFRENRNIDSVTIPDSVTVIEDRAFWECFNLTSVTLPNSITNIYWGTFFKCNRLVNITIPNSVTSIKWSVFSECRSLRSITIPEGVTDIGRSAFNECNSLTSITIPKSVTSIGDGAFSGCTNLTSVTFQGTITNLRYAFDGDLEAKYIASDGGPGTYIRFANGETWKKQ